MYEVQSSIFIIYFNAGCPFNIVLWTLWPEKNRQMPKNDFTRKMKAFDTYTKIA